MERDEEYEDSMASITYPDVDRLSFWGVPYQFDYVFGPGTEQAQARILIADFLLLIVVLYPASSRTTLHISITTEV